MKIKQIEKKAKEIVSRFVPNEDDDEFLPPFYAQKAAMEMAEWLLSHQWVRVEDYAKDELPPLIDNNDPYGESVQVLFIVELDGIQYVNKGCFDYDTGVWHSLDMQCSYLKENVTHWMPIPPLAEEGGEK